jgi:hypothetical protein
MKRYEGRRVNGIAEVHVNGVPLNPRLDLRKHSLTGFEWGYEGSGPAQLALAVLADYLEDDELALERYQFFKRAMVARCPYVSWALEPAEIDRVLEAIPA